MKALPLINDDARACFGGLGTETPFVEKTPTTSPLAPTVLRSSAFTLLDAPERRSCPGFNISVTVAGKFGELLQGVRRDHSPLLVSAVTTDGHFTVSAESHGAEPFMVQRTGQVATKAARAARDFMVRHDLDLHLAPQIKIQSRTPVGKGLASSSQDTAAAIQLVARWFNEPWMVRDIYGIQCSIERSDFLLRPGRLTLTDPVSGNLGDLCATPALWIIGWDDAPESQVLTAAVAHVDRKRIHRADEYESLLTQLSTGTATNVIEASTRSATLNQAWLPKPRFVLAASIAKKYGGGIVAAHTGTMLGIILPGGPAGDPACLSAAYAEIRNYDLDPIVHTLGA